MAKVVEIVTDKVEKEITFLSNVNVKFVSLVKHGANRVPFKVIKSENKGGVDSSMVIQSILVPKNQNFDSLSTEKGLEWLADAKKDNSKKYDTYSKYEQMPIEEFKKETIGMVQLTSNGVWAIVGKTEKEANKNALTLGKREIEKYMEIPVSPGDVVVAEVRHEPRPVTFNEMFERELYSFLDIVKGAISQTKSNPAKRRKTVVDSLEAFRSFLIMGLDAIEGNTIKEKGNNTLNGLENKISQISKALKALKVPGKEEESMSLFKDEKEFNDAVLNILKKEKEEEAKIAEEAKKKEDAEKEEAKKKEEAEKEANKNASDKDNSELSAAVKKIEEISNKVDSIVEKQEKIENQLVTDPASGQNSTDAVTTKNKEDKDKSVFSGLLKKKG